jgi:hypothetical protein
MKTGNSILAAFFFYMAFKIPLEINILSLDYDIPDAEFFKILSIVLFGVCILLGCMSWDYGRENRITDVKDIKNTGDMKILDLPVSLKNSLSVDDNQVVTNHEISKVEEDKTLDEKDKGQKPVDKTLPVIKVVEQNNDDFAKISTNINDVIALKTKRE